MTAFSLGVRRPSRKLLLLYFVRSLAGLAFQPLVFLPLYFKFITLEYHFEPRGIRASWGVLFRREVFLAYGRIQDIHVKMGIVQRWLGLGTVELQTAAGSSSAELSIDGLEDYLAIRDFLYSRMRGTGEDTPADADSVATVLALIRDDLRQLRTAMEKPHV
jgi:putative membrane protein